MRLFIGVALLALCANCFGQAKRVVLISLDAGSNAIIDDFLARGILKSTGAFGRMLAQGTHAEAMIPPTVSSTPISHAAMFSGMQPAGNGIVGITVPLAGRDIRAGGNGFDIPTERDRLWTMAQRDGKRVVCLNVPGANASRPDDTCTFTMAFPRLLSEAAVVEMSGADAQQFEIKMLEGPSLPLTATRVGEHRYRIGADCTVKSGRRCTLVLKAGWIDVELLTGAARDTLSLSALITQPTNDAARLMTMQAALGYSPVEPSGRLTNQGKLPEEAWLAANYRVAGYNSESIEFILKRNDWDLLMTYLPLLDQVEHRYLLVDPRQSEYGLEGGARRRRYQKIVEDAYRLMDAKLSQWMRMAPDGTAFVVVSDHGMAPTHSTVRLMNLLAESGLHVAAAGPTDVWALSNGSSAHIYVNARGRFADGTVDDAAVAGITAGIVQTLEAFRDQKSGQRIFDVVRAHENLADLGLDHQRSGDVFVSARPGWSISTRYLMGGSLVVPNTFRPDARGDIESPIDRQFMEAGTANETGLGVHGHAGGPRSVEAIFYAIGAGVPKQALGKINAVDVAPSVLYLLGLPSPCGLDGHNVWAPRSFPK